MDKMMQLYYDQQGDVLYLSVGSPRAAVSEEVGNDVLVRITEDTGEVVGITVLNFAARFSSLNEPHHLPVEVELKALIANDSAGNS